MHELSSARPVQPTTSSGEVEETKLPLCEQHDKHDMMPLYWPFIIRTYNIHRVIFVAPPTVSKILESLPDSLHSLRDGFALFSWLKSRFDD